MPAWTCWFGSLGAEGERLLYLEEARIKAAAAKEKQEKEKVREMSGDKESYRSKSTYSWGLHRFLELLAAYIVRSKGAGQKMASAARPAYPPP
eukprot:1155320-Pelagomonas_calceolata.AAC.1